MKRLWICAAASLFVVGCHTVAPPRDPQPEWSRTRTDVALRSSRISVERNLLSRARSELDRLGLMVPGSDPRMHLLLAQVAVEEDELGEAREHLDRCRRLHPAVATAPQTDGVVSHADRGAEVLASNIRLAVLGPGFDASQHYSLPVVFHLLRGLVNELEERWIEAADAYRTAAAGTDDPRGPILAQVRALHAAGDAANAAIVLDRAARDRPNDVELSYLAGEELFAGGDYVGSIRHFDRVLHLEPSHDPAKRHRGLALHFAGKHAEAVRALEPWVGGSRPDGLSLALARSALCDDRASLAASVLRPYVEAFPNDPDALYDFASALFLLDRPRDAMDAARQVLALKPEHRSALVLVGHVHYQAGRWQEATTSYEEAIRHGADEASLRLLLDTIASQAGTSP